jgi:hypothetical protein
VDTSMRRGRMCREAVLRATYPDRRSTGSKVPASDQWSARAAVIQLV